MSRRAGLVLAALVLAACGSPAPRDYQVASGTLSGGQEAGLVTHFGSQRLSFALDAYGAGLAGKGGTVEIRGPLHLVCEGSFSQARAPEESVFDVFLSPEEREERHLRHLPVLEFPSLRLPRGSYAIALTRPQAGRPFGIRFGLAGDLPQDAVTRLYRNDGCTEVADTSAQRREAVSQHLAALAIVIPQTGDAAFRQAATDRNNQAAVALARDDLNAAAADLDRIQALAAALAPTHVTEVLAAVAREGAALLRQQLPS